MIYTWHSGNEPFSLPAILVIHHNPQRTAVCAAYHHLHTCLAHQQDVWRNRLALHPVSSCEPTMAFSIRFVLLIFVFLLTFSVVQSQKQPFKLHQQTAPDDSTPPPELAGGNGPGSSGSDTPPPQRPKTLPRNLAIAVISITIGSAIIAILACVWCCVLRPERSNMDKSPAGHTKAIPLPPTVAGHPDESLTGDHTQSLAKEHIYQISPERI
ncbi:unnamed protein product [Chondrus crispus]|uniref:Uncharacterized protein n=1 Tax=Chondrus crispus TaxID=2769 RepID=R7QKQ6_CHOCR|nr:unnamed protein product [Chondrus crispus]CDF38664.1 unnamed protein product [Chondrus crispus]|eukprot:XP_005718569.1 unnamed protein product [Chondrus crispus]